MTESNINFSCRSDNERMDRHCATRLDSGYFEVKNLHPTGEDPMTPTLSSAKRTIPVPRIRLILLCFSTDWECSRKLNLGPVPLTVGDKGEEGTGI